MLTPEQLALRKTGIGGSDAAAICGHSKYATPLDIYLDKTTPRLKKTTDVMERGNVLEPFVKALFERKTGWHVEKVPSMLRGEKHSFMLANLDGYVPAERAIAEFKTADYSTLKDHKNGFGEEGTDDIPREYLIQVAHYASVLQADIVYIGVLFGNDRLFNSYMENQQSFVETGRPINFDRLACDFRLYIYKRHQILEERLIKKEKHFWFDYVSKGIQPPLQVGHLDDVLKAYPRATDKARTISGDDLNKIQSLISLKKQIKDLEELEKSSRAEVLKLFGEASLLIDENNNKIASWKEESRTKLDCEEFEKVHPGLLSEFTKTTTNRTFRMIRR